MTNVQLAATAVRLFQMFQNSVPIDTGNMRYNATRFESRGNGEYAIIIDGNIAPYNVFTNEPWLSSTWKGKQNPNEGWIDSGADMIAKLIATELGGELRRIEK